MSGYFIFSGCLLWQYALTNANLQERKHLSDFKVAPNHRFDTWFVKVKYKRSAFKHIKFHKRTYMKKASHPKMYLTLKIHPLGMLLKCINRPTIPVCTLIKKCVIVYFRFEDTLHIKVIGIIWHRPLFCFIMYLIPRGNRP